MPRQITLVLERKYNQKKHLKIILILLVACGRNRYTSQRVSSMFGFLVLLASYLVQCSLTSAYLKPIWLKKLPHQQDALQGLQYLHLSDGAKPMKGRAKIYSLLEVSIDSIDNKVF